MSPGNKRDVSRVCERDEVYDIIATTRRTREVNVRHYIHFALSCACVHC